MEESFNHHCPKIDPVPAGAAQPLWSVMIPAYHCASYLRQTLESVLCQDPGPERMGITVVDPCSDQDDPKGVVDEMGRTRLSYVRLAKNGGSTATFNECLRRTTGRLIHILHGDDYVEPGFYREIEALASAYPEMALYCTRGFIVDKDGGLEWVSPRIPHMEKGTRDAAPFFYLHSIPTPAMVIRRSFYEQHGGFNEFLNHTADWEMGIRVVSEGGGVILNKPLVNYRYYGESQTGQFMRMGENLRDCLRFGRLMAARFKEFDTRRHLYRLAGQAEWQIKRFKKAGDGEAVKASRAMWWKTSSLSVKLGKFLYAAYGLLRRKVLR